MKREDSERWENREINTLRNWRGERKNHEYKRQSKSLSKLISQSKNPNKLLRYEVKGRMAKIQKFLMSQKKEKHKLKNLEAHDKITKMRRYNR